MRYELSTPAVHTTLGTYPVLNGEAYLAISETDTVALTLHNPMANEAATLIVVGAGVHVTTEILGLSDATVYVPTGGSTNFTLNSTTPLIVKSIAASRQQGVEDTAHQARVAANAAAESTMRYGRDYSYHLTPGARIVIDTSAHLELRLQATVPVTLEYDTVTATVSTEILLRMPSTNRTVIASHSHGFLVMAIATYSIPQNHPNNFAYLIEA